jgi:hypothetical protein
MGVIMSESKGKQTHTTGDVYTHPRGNKYRDNFSRIFGKESECEYGECICSRQSCEKESDA